MYTQIDLFRLKMSVTSGNRDQGSVTRTEVCLNAWHAQGPLLDTYARAYSRMIPTSIPSHTSGFEAHRQTPGEESEEGVQSESDNHSFYEVPLAYIRTHLWADLDGG